VFHFDILGMPAGLCFHLRILDNLLLVLISRCPGNFQSRLEMRVMMDTKADGN
jgi:hypothetical protein